MGGSLQERIAAQRERLQQERTITLSVPGYRTMLAATYKPLVFEELRKISMKHEQIGVDPADEVAAAIDALNRACLDLLEITGKDEQGSPQYRSLGKTWTVPALREYFGVDLPEDPPPTVRQAMRAALSSDQIMEHFGEFMVEAGAIAEEIEGAAEGESEAVTDAH